MRPIIRSIPLHPRFAPQTQTWRLRRTFATEVGQKPHDEKERVVILGSGWGGYIASRRLSQKNFIPVVISPRSYFVFTPLLTDTAGGDLDFSHIVEPVRDSKIKVDFIQAAARAIDLDRKTVLCEPTIVKSGVTETHSEEEDHNSPKAIWEQGEAFHVPYDKLVIAVGAISRTFRTPGVKDNAIFFRDVGDSRRVRRRVRECFELANLPTASLEMRKHLLHFAIVGAGPTGTELAAALRDFIVTDLVALYPALDGLPRISLYDVAPKVLSMFDESLSKYAMDTMKGEGIDVRTSHHIKNLRWGAPDAEPPYEFDPRTCLTLTTEEEGPMGVGMCVWATGNAPNELVRDAMNTVDVFPANSATVQGNNGSPEVPARSSWSYRKAPGIGSLLVDGHLRVQLQDDTGAKAVLQDVFAIGDNATPENGAPPATAQVTSQEAKWLSARLNNGDIATSPPFSFHNLGTLAYVGNAKALIQLPEEESKYLPNKVTGRTAWLVWNSAYLTMTISWRNRIRVAFRWMLNWVFGRDISRY